MWFTVNGAGTAPTPGGTAIKVDILSTHTPVDVRQIVMSVLSGYNISDATMTAASSITTGSYFNIYNYANDPYYVWYQKGGSGVDPSPAGAIKGIKVELLGSETSPQVVFKTQAAINSAMWASPDLRGMFLRSYMGSSTTPNIDPDVLARSAYCSDLSGNNIGSVETTQNLIHNHSINTFASQYDVTGGTYPTSGWFGNTSSATGNSGGNQSNPINFYVNYVIKI